MNEIRLKYLVSDRITTGASESASDYNPKETRYIRISDFDENGSVRENSKVSISNTKAEKFLLKKNDILIAVTGATVGKSMIFGLSEKAAYAGYLALIRTNDRLNYKYLYYYLNSPLFDKWRKESINVSTIENISASKYANLPIYYYDVKKQIEIVSILDTISLHIDKLIYNQQQQIEKLKEYKQSLISEVVTKGLNPNVEFKDSGIEWIGKIPAHWKMVFLSSVFYEHKLKNTNLVNTNLLSLSYGNIVNKDINTRDGLLPDSFEGYNIVSNNDIVLRLTDLQNDKKSLRVGLCTQEGIITSAYITIRAKVDLNSYYFHKLLHSYDINKVFYGMGSGVRQSMGFNEIRKIPLLLPPKNEMKIISERVQETVCKIDALITLKESKLEKLIDYKKSLIYEYVTGKKEVS